MKLALMIIDLQKAYYQEESKKSIDSATEYINAVLPMFRKKKLPIIWVQDVDKGDGVVPGTEGFELIEALEPLESEHVVHKHYGNSFNKTNCADIIRDNQIDMIIMTGFCAEYCVLSTYRGALDLDLTPVLLKNGIASVNQDNLHMVENMSNIISYGVLKKMLEQSE